MTKERKEQLSNRLVLNFGMLLAGALILLYVYNALRSSATVQNYTYLFLATVAVISIIGAVVLYFVGIKKQTNMKNYSGIFLGTLIGSAAIYIAKPGWIPGYSATKAVVYVYIAMVVYFVILSAITGWMMRKPIEMVEKEEKTKGNQKKKKKKKK